MNGLLATYRRELRAYFFSPLAYVVLFFFLAVNGFIFVALVGNLNDPGSPGGPPAARRDADRVDRVDGFVDILAKVGYQAFISKYRP